MREMLVRQHQAARTGGSCVGIGFDISHDERNVFSTSMNAVADRGDVTLPLENVCLQPADVRLVKVHIYKAVSSQPLWQQMWLR